MRVWQEAQEDLRRVVAQEPASPEAAALLERLEQQRLARRQQDRRVATGMLRPVAAAQ